MMSKIFNNIFWTYRLGTCQSNVWTWSLVRAFAAEACPELRLFCSFDRTRCGHWIKAHQCASPRVCSPSSTCQSPCRKTVRAGPRAIGRIDFVCIDTNVVPVDTSSRSRLSWWPTVSGCIVVCFRAWGHSEWCWARSRLGTWELCRVVGRICVLDWEKRLESWCCATGRTGCRRAVRKQDTNGYDAWNGPLVMQNQIR